MLNFSKLIFMICSSFRPLTVLDWRIKNDVVLRHVYLTHVSRSYILLMIIREVEAKHLSFKILITRDEVKAWKKFYSVEMAWFGFYRDPAIVEKYIPLGL